VAAQTYDPATVHLTPSAQARRRKAASLPAWQGTGRLPAMFLGRLLPLMSISTSILFREARIYFTENRAVETDVDGKGASGSGLRPERVTLPGCRPSENGAGSIGIPGGFWRFMQSSPQFSEGFYCGGGSGHVCCVALGPMPVCAASLRNLVRNRISRNSLLTNQRKNGGKERAKIPQRDHLAGYKSIICNRLYWFW
jgi:hypothetical protein